MERRIDELCDFLRRAVGSDARGVNAVTPKGDERGVQHALGFLEPDVLLHPPEYPEPVEREVGKRPRVVHRIRKPQIGWAPRLDPREACFRHTNDLKRSI